MPLLSKGMAKYLILNELVPGYKGIKHKDVENCLYGDVEETKQILSQVTVVFGHSYFPGNMILEILLS